MKIVLTLSLSLFTLHYCFAQYGFSKQWDFDYGGLHYERLTNIFKSANGGFLLTGISSSGAGGDKSQANWDTFHDTLYLTYDIWIVGLDSLGNKLFEKSFGGPDNDYVTTAIPLSQGGFILGGYGNGGGDMTQPSLGLNDIWLIKIDNNGNKEWDKRYGTNDGDGVISFLQTADKGLIIGSYSSAGVNTDKTEPNRDPLGLTSDFWLLKLDSNGNRQWDKTFGGNSQDIFSSLVPTNDGGYLLAGSSMSDSSGDKSQDTYAWGYDFWIVKADSLGNKKWDKRYGGTAPDDMLSTAIKAPDNGFFLIGVSGSNSLVGDKSTDKAGIWILKIDSSGNKLWDKTISPSFSEFGNVSSTSDGGFLLSGNSEFNAIEEKSEDNMGATQTWIIKTDSSFNKEWDKTILTPGSEFGFALQVSDECFMVANDSWEMGGYKSQMSWDSSADYWIMKFCMDATDIKEVTDELEVSVYPNPFTSDVSINLLKQNMRQAIIQITNTTGQIVYKHQEENLKSLYIKNVDLSYLPSALYLLETTVDGEKVVRRIVKE